MTKGNDNNGKKSSGPHNNNSNTRYDVLREDKMGELTRSEQYSYDTPREGEHDTPKVWLKKKCRGQEVTLLLGYLVTWNLPMVAIAHPWTKLLNQSALIGVIRENRNTKNKRRTCDLPPKAPDTKPSIVERNKGELKEDNNEKVGVKEFEMFNGPGDMAQDQTMLTT